MEKKNIFEWQVSQKENNKKLLFFIKEKTDSKLSNRAVKKIIEKGVLKVNSKTECYSSCVLKEKDTVKLEKKYKNLFSESSKTSFYQNSKINSSKEIKILYEDDFFFLIDKPLNFICSQEEIEKHFKNSFLVHRLDKETTGVLLVAKSLEVKNRFKELFSSKNIEKEYILVVDGKLKKKNGLVKSFIKKVSKVKHSKIIFKSFLEKSFNAKYAKTYFETINSSKFYSFVKCIPITGRTHQIRVHMLDIGHPILGDYQYFLNFKYPKHVSRLMLHCKKLKFFHPVVKDKKIEVKAKIPKEFLKMM